MKIRREREREKFRANCRREQIFFCFSRASGASRRGPEVDTPRRLTTRADRRRSFVAGVVRRAFRLSFSRSVCLSVGLSVCWTVGVPVYRVRVCLFACLLVCVSICLFVSPSVCQLASLFSAALSVSPPPLPVPLSFPYFSPSPFLYFSLSLPLPPSPNSLSPSLSPIRNKTTRNNSFPRCCHS